MATESCNEYVDRLNGDSERILLDPEWDDEPMPGECGWVVWGGTTCTQGFADGQRERERRASEGWNGNGR
jgi:hypothetical protein